MTKGVILLIVGVVALITVYSLRPPSGFGDALMMMGQGRNFYLKEPVYLGLMGRKGDSSLFFKVLVNNGLNCYSLANDSV